MNCPLCEKPRRLPRPGEEVCQIHQHRFEKFISSLRASAIEQERLSKFSDAEIADKLLDESMKKIVEPQWDEVTNGVWRIGVSRGAGEWTALAVEHQVVVMDQKDVEQLVRILLAKADAKVRDSIFYYLRLGER